MEYLEQNTKKKQKYRNQKVKKEEKVEEKSCILILNLETRLLLFYFNLLPIMNTAVICPILFPYI